MKSIATYQPPLAELLELGMPDSSKPLAPEFIAKFTDEHIPELIRLGQDSELHLEGDEAYEHAWAGPIYAWQILGKLKAESAIAPMIECLNTFDEDTDWIDHLAYDFFGIIGAPALPALETYILKTEHDMYRRATASNALVHIVENDSNTRPEAVRILTSALALYEQNDPTFNAFLIGYLFELKAVESITTIAEVYLKERVDYSVVGGLSEIQAGLGLPITVGADYEDEQKAKWIPFGFPEFGRWDEALFELTEKGKKNPLLFPDGWPSENKKADAKKKSKRKMAEKSRKRNRKK